MSMTEPKPLLSSVCITRRQWLGAAAVTLLGASGAIAAPHRNADGLEDEPWLLKTRELGKEFAAALAARKQFAILWEMPNCPWCQLLHREAFRTPEIVAYIEKHFAVQQLNFIGARTVGGFDGKALPDSALAGSYEVISSPTMQFFVPDAATPGRELGRVGYLKAPEFFGMLRFVQEKGYEEGPFDEWFAKHP